MKITIIIGIDPDMNKSGVAFFDRNKRVLSLRSLTLGDLIKSLEEFNRDTTLFVVEAGYLNKSNWHVRNVSINVAAEVGRRTGENHAASKNIVNVVNAFGFDCIELRPLAKVWKGGKISTAELCEKIKADGIIWQHTRCNQEERDAALIALAYDKMMTLKNK